MSDAPDVVLVAAVALIDSAQRVLVQRRPQGKSLAGLWEFPGGKVEDAETPEEALRREIVEELGIELGAICPFTFATAPLTDKHLVLLLYTCQNWQGEPRALHADAVKWVDRSELASLKMPPADAPLVKMLDLRR